ncbi:hypothetical protein NL676_018518 [Syzygium grande]|nr:hypothetical protein NL676_018518 [Syzygium grande]
MPEEDSGALPVIIEMDTKFEGEKPMDWESDTETEPEPIEQELKPEGDSGAKSVDAESEPDLMDSEYESSDDSSESSGSNLD